MKAAVKPAKVAQDRKWRGEEQLRTCMIDAGSLEPDAKTIGMGLYYSRAEALCKPTSLEIKLREGYELSRIFAEAKGTQYMKFCGT